jgi:hypothetical protein
MLFGHFLKGQNDLAAIGHFAAVYVGAEAFTPGDRGDRAAGELYAQVQLERTPFDAETIDAQKDNLRWYLAKCGFLPKVYAQKLTDLCLSKNPLSTTIGTTLINGAITANSAAQKALDDSVVARANFIGEGIAGGIPTAMALRRTEQIMNRARNQDRDAIEVELKRLKSNDAKFYSGEISVEKYGYDGRDFFRRQVDFNFRLNGGNRDLAVKQASATTKARYMATGVGYYGQNRRCAGIRLWTQFDGLHQSCLSVSSPVSYKKKNGDAHGARSGEIGGDP